MENSTHLENNVTNPNITLTTQTLVLPNNAILNQHSNLLPDVIIADQNNQQIIHEMEIEIALWIIRAICYFIFTLLLYINLEFPMPILAIFCPLLILNIFLIMFYSKQLQNDTYFDE